MKKWLILTFSFAYLISTTELCQLMKLPALATHFLEHQSENKTLTFAEFLVMHYAQVDDNDGDAEKDQKLPFKSHSVCCNSINYVVFNALPVFIFPELLCFETSKNNCNFYSFIVSSSNLKSIWQPPQI